MDSDSDEEGSGASSAVIVKKKRANHNPLVQSTGAVSRRSKLGGAASDEEQDEVYGIDSEEASRGTLSYRDRLSDSTTTRSTSDSLQKIRDDATRHSNWDLEDSAPTSFSAAAANNTSNSNADGLYRGAKGYSSFITARDDGTSSKMRSRGPIRQTTTVRTTSLMDYQPDICKDYKETGYCGFGDTCKFLHDRSDYLAGWQLDVLPNSTSRTREDLLSDPEAEESEEEIPFACLICRQPFEDPVVTRCGHYFCSACAIKRFAKNSKCFACGAQTGGLFNSAKKVLDKMGRRKEQKMQAREERIAGEVVGMIRSRRLQNSVGAMMRHSLVLEACFTTQYTRTFLHLCRSDDTLSFVHAVCEEFCASDVSYTLWEKVSRMIDGGGKPCFTLDVCYSWRLKRWSNAQKGMQLSRAPCCFPALSRSLIKLTATASFPLFVSELSWVTHNLPVDYKTENVITAQIAKRLYQRCCCQQPPKDVTFENCTVKLRPNNALTAYLHLVCHPGKVHARLRRKQSVMVGGNVAEP